MGPRVKMDGSESVWLEELIAKKLSVWVDRADCVDLVQVAYPFLCRVVSLCLLTSPDGKLTICFWLSSVWLLKEVGRIARVCVCVCVCAKEIQKEREGQREGRNKRGE